MAKESEIIRDTPYRHQATSNGYIGVYNAALMRFRPCPSSLDEHRGCKAGADIDGEATFDDPAVGESAGRWPNGINWITRTKEIMGIQPVRILNSTNISGTSLC